jgi:hypothetical protein
LKEKTITINIMCLSHENTSSIIIILLLTHMFYTYTQRLSEDHIFHLKCLSKHRKIIKIITRVVSRKCTKSKTFKRKRKHQYWHFTLDRRRGDNVKSAKAYGAAVGRICQCASLPGSID